MTRTTSEHDVGVDVSALAAALELDLDVYVDDSWPLRLSRVVASARSHGESDIVGTAAAPTRAEAILRAVLEHIERRAQFDPPVHPRTEWGSYRSLGPVAVEPSEFGLYTRVQCSRAGFGLAPHHPDAPLDWVSAVDLLTGNDRLVPIEFVYPRAPLVRLPIVAETSSGTAAHFDAELALQGALLELVERDAAMIFWYRQPRTTIVQVESVPVPELREELRAVQELGFVVALCHLASDIGLPCFLVLALRGARVAYGLGCAPSHGDAVAHALRELGARLRWLVESPPLVQAHVPLPDVRTPEDHCRLYDAGPLHDVLRRHLAATLDPAHEAIWPPSR